MKRIIASLCVLSLLCLIWVQSGLSLTINGQAPGSTAASTPFPIGTSTPVVIMACGTTLNGTTGFSTLYVHMCVSGGTASTDGVYCMPALASAPCASPTPAPVSSSVAASVGMWIPSGGAGWTCQDFNAFGAGGVNWLSNEWSCVGTHASMSMEVVTFP